jgi:hypothetical protein
MRSVVEFRPVKLSGQTGDVAAEALEWAWQILCEEGHESTSRLRADGTLNLMMERIDQAARRGTNDPFCLASEAIAAAVACASKMTRKSNC